MGLKYYSNELNNYGNILPLSSDIDLSLYANTCVSYNQKYQPLSSEISMIKKYTNTYNSIQKNIYANIPQQSPYETLINTTTLDENNNNQLYENFKLHPTSSVNPSLSSHIYINLEDHEDEPPVIPTSILKIDQKEDVSLSSIHHIDIETNVLEKRSNIKTKQTVKKSEINMAPNCRDKSDLYRTKIPSTITRIHPSIRQRRTLHCSRRHRRRSSTHIRTTMHSNAIRRQQQHSNQTITHNRRKRSSNKSIYNRIQQPIVYDNQSMNSFFTEEIFECPKKFHGALQNEIVSWYSAKTELVPQVFSTSENGESVHQDETANEEEEEEELCPHDTFEDFLLRRRPKSSCSTLASVTNTLVSETISEKVPARPPPLKRPSPGVSLSLDKKDVDFIHEIIQRSHGDQRVSNRITALREAYVRAADKRNDLLKTKKIPQIDQNKNKEKPSMKHSIIASKIRDELEKYDELPVHRKPSFDDDDNTYSINENYRYHHRKLPPVPSTSNRIINFVTTLKRQLQKNFHEIRSRVIIEMMSKPSQNRPIFHNSSSRSHRQRSQIQPKASYTNSRYSIERSYPSHRHQFSCACSDTSQIHSDQRLSHRPRTFRVTPHLPQRQKMN